MTVPRQSNDSRQTTAILLWVGIAAGVVFIVAVVFFSGFVIGRHSGGGSSFGDRDRVPGMMWPNRTGPYGPMGPGMMGPNGPWGPGQQPSTSAVPSSSPSAPPR